MKRAKSRQFEIVMFILNNKALFLMVIMATVSVIITNGLSITPYNISGISRQIAVFAIISVGYTILLASGQLDLSIGEIVSLSGVLYALASKALPLWVAIIIAILVAVFCEFLNGVLIRFLDLPGFVLTLAMAQIFNGVTHIITDGKSIGSLSDALKYFGQGRLFGVIPMAFIIMFIVVILVAILLSKTIYGRRLIATGGNAEAANVSGINVDKMKITAGMVAGVCIGIGTIVLTGRVATAVPTAGSGYALDAIAAVVIGGTHMGGGKAKVMGTLFGVTLIGIINNMLNLEGVGAFWQWVTKGFIIILAIVLDSLTEKFLYKRRVVAESFKDSEGAEIQLNQETESL